MAFGASRRVSFCSLTGTWRHRHLVAGSLTSKRENTQWPRICGPTALGGATDDEGDDEAEAEADADPFAEADALADALADAAEALVDGVLLEGFCVATMKPGFTCSLSTFFPVTGSISRLVLLATGSSCFCG